MTSQETSADLLNSESYLGEFIRPNDEGYDEARAVFNAMIDKRPALIARPTNAGHVSEAVNLARKRGLPLAVRCGGHSVSGMGTCDDGVLVTSR
jgi:FAD/FMN-containing dehydrogenase